MAFDLSSPVAKLAFEMALRNQQAQDSSAPFDASARSFVSQALSRGNEQLSDYEDIYRQYVDPAEAQRRAQAAAFNEYLIGLPELLAKSAQERRGSGGTGSPDVDTTNLSNYESAEDRFNRLLGTTTSTSTYKPFPTYRTPEYNDARKTATKSGMGSGVTAKRLS
jgi:hypothetical protein